MKKEQSSILTPNKELVGVKKSEKEAINFTQDFLQNKEFINI